MSNSESLLSDELLARLPVHEGHKVIGPVVLYDKIGKGGMGAVYKGRHMRLNVDVAVKIMSPELTAEPEFTVRFQREARAAVSLNHPNLVRCFDVNHENDLYYMILEFIEGRELADYIETRAPAGMHESEIYTIMSPVLDALVEIHKRGIIHRDIKPENIMIADDGRVVLMDLGLAKIAEEQAEELTMRGQALGTPVFMAPEQWTDSRHVGPAADIWSIGVCLYQMTTGKLPWNTTNITMLMRDIMTVDVTDPRFYNPTVSDETTALIMRCLNRNPAERISAFELQQRFRSVSDTRKLPTQFVDGEAKTVLQGSGDTVLNTDFMRRVEKEKQDGEQQDTLRRRMTGKLIGGGLILMLVLAVAGGAGYVYKEKRRMETLRQQAAEKKRLADQRETERIAQFRKLTQDAKRLLNSGDFNAAADTLHSVKIIMKTDVEKAQAGALDAELTQAVSACAATLIRTARAALNTGDWPRFDRNMAELGKLELTDGLAAERKTLRAQGAAYRTSEKQLGALSAALDANDLDACAAKVDQLQRMSMSETQRRRFTELNATFIRVKAFEAALKQTADALNRGDIAASEAPLIAARQAAAGAMQIQRVDALFDVQRALKFDRAVNGVLAALGNDDIEKAARSLKDARRFISDTDDVQRARLEAASAKVHAAQFHRILTTIRDALKTGDTATADRLIADAETMAATDSQRANLDKFIEYRRKQTLAALMNDADIQLTAGQLSPARDTLKQIAEIISGKDESAAYATLVKRYNATVKSRQFDTCCARAKKRIQAGDWHGADAALDEAMKNALDDTARKKVAAIRAERRQTEFDRIIRDAAAAANALDFPRAERLAAQAVTVCATSAEAARCMKAADAAGNLAAGYYLCATARGKAQRRRLKTIAEAGHAKAQWLIGRTALHSRAADVSPATAMLKKSAAAGYPQAKTDLGWCLLYGIGVTRDATQAARMFRDGFKGGDARGAIRLGDMYRDGMGVPKNLQLALDWYRQAAKAGSMLGQVRLGVSLYNGNGTDKDVFSAAKLFKSAADAGDPAGKYRLSICLMTGIGARKDTGAAFELLKSAAESGDPNAMLDYASRLLTGNGVPMDGLRAVTLLKKAAGVDHAPALVKLGDCYQNGDGVSKDPRRAADCYARAARFRDPRGMFRLAECLFRGTGRQRDIVAAIKWYRAAAAEYPPAWVRLGDVYLTGNGVKKDASVAYTYYKSAAERNDPDGQYKLGMAFINGSGIGANIEEGIRWLRRAAGQHQVDAQYELGNIYFTGTGVPISKATALKWYTASAAQGHATAQSRVGEFYLRGWTVAKNLTTAAKWFRLSADQSDPNGMNCYAECLVNGWGVSADPKAAFNLFKKAADSGLADAQNNLGDCFRLGRGTTMDPVEMIRYYTLAADQNLPVAQYRLARCYELGSGTAKNAQNAFSFYKKAAEQGYADAQYQLGNCYQSGFGTAKNRRQALKWYKKAARQGHEKARRRVTASGSPW